ncbi:hypothetical protein LTS17_001927 [Exophiala oligosperma]
MADLVHSGLQQQAGIRPSATDDTTETQKLEEASARPEGPTPTTAVGNPNATASSRASSEIRPTASIRSDSTRAPSVDSTTGRETPRGSYTAVEVLLLTFQFTDLGRGLREETAQVKNTFQSLGYTVRRYNIKMRNSMPRLQTALETFLEGYKRNETTLLIIYYHGHGGPVENNRFAFLSHNYPKSTYQLWNTVLDLFDNQMDERPVHANQFLRQRENPYQRIASIHWDQIYPDIMHAKYDTLIILDCCNAGLAAVRDVENEYDEDGDVNQNVPELDDGQDDISDIDADDDDDNDDGGGGDDDDAIADGGDGDDNDNYGDQGGDDQEAADDGNQEVGAEVTGNGGGNGDHPVQRLKARKELIGACGWGVSTSNHMSPAMCKVLSRRLHGHSTMSTFTLVSEMNGVQVREWNYTADPNEEVPQAVHYVLRERTHAQPEEETMQAGKITLHRIPRLHVGADAED